jgi:hypothetical protein
MALRNTQLRANVAEHTQLLVVVSTPRFFFPSFACGIEGLFSS